MKTHKELITEYLDFEVWESRYSWESWITSEPLIDIRTNKIYKSGEWVFALISYLDDNNKIVYLNELQYLQKYTEEKPDEKSI